MASVLFLFYIVFTLIVLYRAMSPVVWEIGSAFYLILATFVIGMPWVVTVLLCVLILSVCVLIHVEAVRFAISDFLFKRMGRSMPTLSKTEEEALNAGDTWLEKDIFTGTPDWEKLASISKQTTDKITKL